MPDGPVVCNNTPLVALWVLKRLDLLRDLFGSVFIPPAVHSEFIAVESEARRAALDSSPWIETRPLDDPRNALVYAGLDRGEAEVLALCAETDARLALIDERRARRFARRLGYPLTGTVGVLLLAKEAGEVTSVRSEMQALEAAGLHLSSALVQQALRMAGEGD